MADRTSAGLFADFFSLLAETPTEEHQAIARKLWPRRLGYDFNDRQMECDDALMALGLAKVGTDPEDGEEVTVYANRDATGWDEP